MIALHISGYRVYIPLPKVFIKLVYKLLCFFINFVRNKLKGLRYYLNCLEVNIILKTSLSPLNFINNHKREEL